MVTVNRPVSVAERRGRLAARHYLAPASRGTASPGGVASAVDGIIALHGTDPASVYLAAWARTGASRADIEHALYAEGALVRMMGMRRTVFVVPAGLVPVIQAACADQIAARLRRDLAKHVRESGIAADADGWLKETGQATVAALAARGSATGAELAQDEPRLRAQLVFPNTEGKNYGAPVNVTSRLLTVLSTEGLIVRGRPRGGWTSMQFTWTVAPAQPALPADAARAELARRWLHAFGPAAPADLQWWAGWTATQTRQALSQLRGQLALAEVDLDGMAGVMLAADQDPPAAAEPWAALLPALDPAAMGWRERDWYLGGHAAALFDRFGNVGPTAWWGGRIVGGWAHRPDGEIAVRLLEDAGAEAAAAIDAEAGRLREWIGDDPKLRITPRFRTPLERELAAS